MKKIIILLILVAKQADSRWKGKLFMLNLSFGDGFEFQFVMLGLDPGI